MRHETAIAGGTTAGVVVGLLVLIAGVLAHEGGEVLQIGGGVVVLLSIFLLAGFLGRL